MSTAPSIFLGDRRTSVFNRLIAKGIDLLIVAAVFFLGKAVWLPLGVFCAAALCAFQDGMGVGQSVGKRIIGLRVIENQTGVSCSFQKSFLRNFSFMLAVIFAAVPVLWIFFILLSLPVIGLEIYLLFTLETGVRLGDVLGNTTVIEYLEESSQVFG